MQCCNLCLKTLMQSSLMGIYCNAWLYLYAKETLLSYSPQWKFAYRDEQIEACLVRFYCALMR